MTQNRHTRQELSELQALPLNLKVRLTQQRIREWVNHYGTDGVAVSFSGGKDSTVLLHLVREMYPDVPGIFCDTGLEYPEIREFVRTFDNIVWLKPKKNFRTVIKKYGYPFISKEVSESVGPAKKYLTKLLAENDALADRQTDRQTDKWHRDMYSKLSGTGRYAKRQNEKSEGRSKSKACDRVGDADKKQGKSSDGEYP